MIVISVARSEIYAPFRCLLTKKNQLIWDAVETVVASANGDGYPDYLSKFFPHIGLQKKFANVANAIVEKNKCYSYRLCAMSRSWTVAKWGYAQNHAR